MAELLFLQYLRFLYVENIKCNSTHNWDDIEEIIKDSGLNEYWRYSIAMDLMK
jgi:hypothetical protein